MKYSNLIVFLLPATALASSTARADNVGPVCGSNVNLPAPVEWPLYERPADVPAALFEITGANQRTGIWNSFGEFQSNSPDFVHTGIDINGKHTKKGGDFAVVAQSGHIFGTHTYAEVDDEVSCVHTDRCKLYIRTDDFRYIYYYAHLDLRADDENDMTPDLDSEMRAKIQKAVGFDDGDQVAADYSETQVTAGQVISGLGTFVNSNTHLHFALFDACKNFDGLSPLDWLKGTAAPDYEDKDRPEIDGLYLIDANEDVIVSLASDRCHEIGEDIDIVAEVFDVWKKVIPEDVLTKGDGFLGTRDTNYRIFNMSTKTSVVSNKWYKFDQIPFRCIGPGRGTTCNGTSAEMSLNGPGGFVEEVNLFGKDMGDIGPTLAHTFADIIYRKTTKWNSEDFDQIEEPQFPPVYFLTLNHEWGVLDANESDERIDVAGLPFGQYQVSVETFDQAGNGRARSVFFKQTATGTPASLTDTMVRDHPEDVGAIPSTLGGNKHWISPDIQVILASENVTLEPDDAIWDTPQATAINNMEDYTVYVRVENTGCENISEFHIRAGSANAAMISMDWESIDVQKHVVLMDPLEPGDATVVEFAWSPDFSGHRCLLAAVNTAGDPLDEDLLDGTTIDFENLDGPAKAFVPFENSLAQRNVFVENIPFLFGNPFGSAIDFGVDFDCNDLPIDLPGATVTLHVESFGSMVTAWGNVPGATISHTPFTNQYLFSLQNCKVQFPAFSVPANTQVNARLEISVPVSGAWRVDLGARVNGVVRDGVSVLHTEP